MNQTLGSPANFRHLQTEECCPSSWKGCPFAYLERLWWPRQKLMTFWCWVRIFTCLKFALSHRNYILMLLIAFCHCELHLCSYRTEAVTSIFTQGLNWHLILYIGQWMAQEETLELQLSNGTNCSLISFNLFAFLEEKKTQNLYKISGKKLLHSFHNTDIRNWFGWCKSVTFVRAPTHCLCHYPISNGKRGHDKNYLQPFPVSAYDSSNLGVRD